MVNIFVCIGSSCHLRGSYDVVEQLKALILKSKLTQKVALKASFCMGDCMHPVCVRVDEQRFQGITLHNVDAFFQEEILSRFE